MLQHPSSGKRSSIACPCTNENIYETINRFGLIVVISVGLSNINKHTYIQNLNMICFSTLIPSHNQNKMF